MIQPEDIIQQKEWHQLSSDEKQIVAPLAEDEQEYNLMKKIFLVSKEELDEVPAISTSVKMAIKQQLPQPKKKWKQGLYWAAAAAIIVATGLWIINQNNVAIEKTDANIVQEITPTPSPKQNIEIAPVEIDDKDTVVNLAQTPVKRIKDRPAVKKNITNNNSIDIAINTSIQSNPDLLNLITELN